MGWQSSRDRKGNDFVKSLPLPFVDHSFTCPLPALCRPVTRPQWWGGAARPSSTTSSDRKSTRLNSSHVKISYAVFCLKKKKFDNPDYIRDTLLSRLREKYHD